MCVTVGCRPSPITPERAALMERAIRSGVPTEVLAREYNTTCGAIQKALERRRKRVNG